MYSSWVDPEGLGTGGLEPTPLKNHKNITNTYSIILVQIPCKITKLPSQDSINGHHLQVSETLFKWRLTDGSVIARL